MPYTPKPDREVICKTCGDMFLSNISNATFCSKACRDGYRDPYERKPVQDVTCEICSTVFQSNKRNATYCSTKCRNTRTIKSPLPDINCHRCNESFTPQAKKAKYCSMECQRITVLETSRKATALTRKTVKCASCPIEFSQKSTRNVYCSDLCKILGHRENKKRFLETEKGKLGVKPQSKEYKQKHYLKTKYRLSMEQYAEMMERQGNACFICDNPQSGERNMCVDHCHSTGKVRALLCTTHNTLLGNCGDDVVMLCKAIAYLILHHPDRFGHITSFNEIIFDALAAKESHEELQIPDIPPNMLHRLSYKPPSW